ncbi:SIR2 family protein [uncultured Roseobacter sp.]|uniref:SIR2 family protein n=1 Tax=uncultured Roseobacter sp. TaxID=114847 RepID=UPI002620FB6F|nr:SIR2 family protein [uncultured Roseobacter sp.]
MSHKSSVAILSSLFRPENDARPTLLLGAGASFTSGIPLAGESVRRLAKQVFAERELGGRVPVDQIKPSEWMNWLRNHEWFLPGDDSLAENFPLIIEHLLQPEAYRRKLLLELTSNKGDIGTGYHALADLVLRGLAGTVMTTNFDLCLPKALAEKQPHIRHVAEVNRSENDFNEFSLFAKAQIVWLHGKAEQYTDRNLIEETKTLDAVLLERLRPLLDATPLVVMGYRGAEDSIMKSLLGDENQKFRQGVYWCTRGSEALHPNVEALKKRLGRNFRRLDISGFDEAVGDLNLELAGIQRFAQPITSQENQEYDDLICEGAVWADVDADLALSTLRRYCEKLERGSLSAAELKPLMREIGLLRKDPEGNELPSNGCVLLFGRQPERFFPHSVLTATVSNKKRTVFQGNLIKQYNDALNWLETKDVNPEIKVKGKQKHVSRLAYPERALIELLVNMIVHRDYEAHQPSTINVEDNYSITFTNPAIMSPRSKVRLATDENGAFDPVPEFSDLRNRSLCDVFFGISAMERAGTGLSDALSLCTDAGGSSLFAFPPGAERFVGKLFRPGASAGSAAVSIDKRPIGTYTLNTLVFSALPQCITKLNIDGGWADLKSKAALTEAGPFVFESRSGLLWTFLDPVLASSIFGGVLKGEHEEVSLATADEDPIIHKKIAWLMRKHFEGYLRSFEEDGLIIEKTKKGFPAKRAYFKSKGQKNRTIVYDSPLRKGIRRGVVKKRGDEGQPWFECEGFGYEIVRFGEGWGVRIKPFYMFTKKDGQSPLPGYLRTKRATRRIRFDRNTNVDSDFVFWGRFLSRGQQTISIGDSHVQDLILEGSFFMADVTEEGLLSDDSSAEDRRPA